MKSSTRGTERRSADLPENNAAARQPCLITCGLEGLVSPEMWFFPSFLAPKEKQTRETGGFWNCALLKTTLMGIFVVSWLSCSFRITEPQLLSTPRVVKSTWRLSYYLKKKQRKVNKAATCILWNTCVCIFALTHALAVDSSRSQEHEHILLLTGNFGRTEGFSVGASKDRSSCIFEYE